MLIQHQKKRKRSSKKGTRFTLGNPERIHNSSTQDESIFVHDITVRRKLWLPKGIRPIVTVTGSHQRTCVFGTLTMEGNNYFASIISLTKTLSLII